jgi:hypothetical protein
MNVSTYYLSPTLSYKKSKQAINLKAIVILPVVGNLP